MREEDDQLYIYRLYGISVPRRFRAKNNIRMRVGENASITSEQVEKAQEIIDRKLIDYSPYVYDCLNQIQDALNFAKETPYLDDIFYNQVLFPFIQIKGQAAMFGNPLASELSRVTVNFIEHYRRFDDDMLNIIDVCCKAIRHSYQHEVYKVESSKGQLLLSELQYVMQRYNEKFKRMTGR
jgi:hypothetical protein